MPCFRAGARARAGQHERAEQPGRRREHAAAARARRAPSRVRRLRGCGCRLRQRAGRRGRPAVVRLIRCVHLAQGLAPLLPPAMTACWAPWLPCCGAAHPPSPSGSTACTIAASTCVSARALPSVCKTPAPCRAQLGCRPQAQTCLRPANRCEACLGISACSAVGHGLWNLESSGGWTSCPGPALSRPGL